MPDFFRSGMDAPDRPPFRILEQTPDFHPYIEGKRRERLLQGFSYPYDREREGMARRRLDHPDNPGQPQH